MRLPDWRRLLDRPIADYVDQPENNYLLLRFVAATMVIYSHSYPLLHLPHQTEFLKSWFRFTHSGEVGLAIFFTISGFLVTASYIHRGGFAYYLKCRALRVIPGLLGCLLFTALLLGPIVTTLSAGDYFSNSGTYSYITGNLSLIKTVFPLPGVYEHLPLPNAVNGSLYTLPAEFRLYMFIGLFGVVGLLGKRNLYLPFMLVLAALALFAPADWALYFNKRGFTSLFLCFAFGSVLRVYMQRIPLSGAILLASVVVLACLYHTRAFQWLFFVPIVYAVFWVAYVPNLHFFNRFGDYSYGLYIYAFPIQQALILYFPGIRPLALFGVAFLLTLICAMLSWHLIESPALKLKSVSFRTYFRRRTTADTAIK
jgi:peptidoglycan/LPS O-acetylase OafA/YrhL